MKRLGIILVVLIGALSAAFMAGAASIVNTKHDLSVASAGATIKSQVTASGGTTEICVFCHTPHTATTDAPLWNRANPVGSYTTYTSDVLSALNYPLIEDPLSVGAAGYQVHVKTRICMSCHDGTIALGSLVNLPAGISSPIAMQNAPGGRIPSTAAGYLGTDLRDDHPVAVTHDPTRDPELQAITGSNVRVYTLVAGRVTPTNGSGGYVECTSCHDVHDNQFGKFLIDSNAGSKICVSCHNKAGDDSLSPDESVHSNTTINTPYSPGTPALGTTVQNVKCMDCHYPHRAGITIGAATPNPGAGKYNLTYQEEQTCFNTTNRWGQVTTVCHGTGASATKNIQAEVNKAFAHHVGNYSSPGGSPHNATEGSTGAGWLGAAGNAWHVECDDCHNAHTAGRLLHTRGTNDVASTSALWGAGGAEPSWPAGWNVPTSFTPIEPIGVIRISGSNLGVTKEYQICLKCHSYFSWGTAGPSSVPTPNLTDQAKEFNPSNASFHPVAGANASTQGTLVVPWTSGNQTMYCSDCHGNNSAIPTDPKGPHGSSATPGYILTANYQDSYVSKGSFVPVGDLCFVCHNETVYQSGPDTTPGTGFWTTGGINLHTRHRNLSNSSALSNTGYSCVNCHVRIPHGYNRKAMILTAGDIDVATYQAAGGAKISGLVGGLLPSSQAYGPLKGDNCSTVAGCHQ